MMVSAEHHRWFHGVLEEHGDIARQVMADIERLGPRSPRDYGGAGAGMWNWTPVKKVFETLWTRGDLTVCERRGFERIYDLTERVIPARYLDEPPSVDECLRFFVRRTVRARGVVTLSRVWDHYRVRGQQRRVAGRRRGGARGGRGDPGPRRRLGRAARARLGGRRREGGAHAGAALPVRQPRVGPRGDASGCSASRTASRSTRVPRSAATATTCCRCSRAIASWGASTCAATARPGSCGPLPSTGRGGPAWRALQRAMDRLASTLGLASDLEVRRSARASRRGAASAAGPCSSSRSLNASR